MCKILCGPPWLKTREEVLSLDPLWVGEVLFCERHKDGRPKLDGEGDGPADFRDQLMTVARLRGYSEEQAEEWAEQEMDRQAAEQARRQGRGEG